MHSKNQRRHCSPSSSSKAPLVPMKPKESASHGGAALAGGGGGGRGRGVEGAEGLPFRVPRDYPHSRFNKAPLAVYPPKGARTKACVSLPVVSLEKMTCFGRTEGGSHIKISSSGSSSSGGTSSFHFSSSSSSSSQSPAASLKSSSLSSVASHKPQVNGRGPATPRSATPPTAHDGRRSPSRSPLDKRPNPSPSSLASSSSQDRRPSASPSPSSLDRRPSASPSPSTSLDRRAAAPPSPLDRKHQNGTKGSRHKRGSGRIFDPNKHCGVLDPETKRACTRSLTCKTHSLTSRRAVPGRKKDFDILLAEHKGRAKEKEVGPKGGSQTGSQASQSHDTTPSGTAHCSNGKTTSTLRLRLANANMHRSSGSGAAAMLSSVPTAHPDPVPSWQRAGGAAGTAAASSASASSATVAASGGAESRLSSDEGEAEAPEDPDKPACHYSPCHPHPMSCCAFNSRLMGRGHYVFDRRWDKIRLVLHSMVEKHVNSQMWKKVPLAAESLTSNSSSPSDFSPPGSAILSPPLFASPAAPPPSLDGVSVVSYSTAFPHNGGGIFCIRDPDPPTPSSSSSSSTSSSSSSSSTSSAKSPRTKPSKSPRAQSEGPRAKRRKPSDGSSHRKNGNGYHPPLPPPPPPPPQLTAHVQVSQNPALVSNGTATLSIKSKASGRIGQGVRDSSGSYSVSGGSSGSRQTGTGGGASLLGDHPLSSHSSVPYGTAAGDSRKRKSSSAGGDRPGKVTKTSSGLDSIFRKSSMSLLAPLPESPHNPHLRQPKVHH